MYRARQDTIGREVALKVDGRVLEEDRDRRRFLREAEAAGRVSDHPHVVKLYDAGVTEDCHPYLIMELCSGGSYSQRLRKEGRLDPSEVRAVGVAIADALQAAHEHGVLHRDVKPGNILITRYGQPGLADFGLAAIPDPNRELSVTIDALTPAFAPPEVFRSEPPTVLGDVYSLGATLYALLSGRPPWWSERHNSIVEVMERRETPLPWIGNVPPRLFEVLEQVLAPDPDDRPASAAEVRDLLADVDVPPRRQQPMRRHVPAGTGGRRPGESTGGRRPGESTGGRSVGAVGDRPGSSAPYGAGSAAPGAGRTGQPPASHRAATGHRSGPAHPGGPGAGEQHPSLGGPRVPGPRGAGGGPRGATGARAAPPRRRRQRVGPATVLLIGVIALAAGILIGTKLFTAAAPPAANGAGPAPPPGADDVVQGTCGRVLRQLTSTALEARCSPQPECWNDVRVTAATPVPCDRPHDFETYVIGTLRNDTNPNLPQTVRTDARVTSLCRPGMFSTAMQQAGRPADGWRIEILGPRRPQEVGPEQRAFRCLAGRDGGSTGSIMVD